MANFTGFKFYFMCNTKKTFKKSGYKCITYTHIKLYDIRNYKFILMLNYKFILIDAELQLQLLILV